MGAPFGGPLPDPFAAMLFVPYDEIWPAAAPTPTGFNPVVLLVICVCEMRTVEPACAVMPCPLFAVMESWRFICAPPVAPPSVKNPPCVLPVAIESLTVTIPLPDTTRPPLPLPSNRQLG